MKNNAKEKPLWYFLKKNWLYIPTFALLLVFSVHNFDSIGQDIGRHLKVGEIIWQIKEIPRTNLFSFTEPDLPFINHHWLSEVIFFGIFSLAGFTGLILLKVFLVFVAFLLLFFAVDNAIGWRYPQLVAFLLSILIFIQRTEVRPEMFSFVILAFFLFVLFRSKYDNAHRYLWLLPVAELLWVNLHIYFFIGPFLVSAFLIDRLANKNYSQLKRIVAVLFLTFAATLANPSGVQGALLPFNVLKEYGYSIVENQTLSFLADFFSFNLSIFVFKLSAGLLVLSLLLTVKKIRSRLFEFIISVFFIYAGFKMLRNLPLYALASFPVMAILLTDVINDFASRYDLRSQTRRLSSFLKVIAAAFLILLIFSVVNNSFYKRTNSSKVFGLSVPNGLERAVNFVKENKIEGPMFNNFDIGGYLIWRFYPEEKVFVDNRPEAYSVKFFSETYKPMQENKEKWLEFSEKYNINFVFFAHTDSTPWGQSFLRNIVKNQDWKIVYVNEDAVILVKNNNKNSKVISGFSITEKNVAGRINEVDSSIVLSRLFYNINWREASVYFAGEAIKQDPKNPRAYLYKGLVHAYYTDIKNQELAAENIKKAIDFGLKEDQYYFILGVAYMNLGRFESARASFKEAIRLDENNTQAKEFLGKYFR